ARKVLAPEGQCASARAATNHVSHHVGQQVCVLAADGARCNLGGRELTAPATNRISDLQRLRAAAARQAQLRRLDGAIVASHRGRGDIDSLSVGVFDALKVVRLHVKAAVGESREPTGEFGWSELQAPQGQRQIVRQGGALKAKALQVVHRVGDVFDAYEEHRDEIS